MSSDLVPRVDQEQVLRILNLDPADPNVQAMFLICERYGLDPLMHHMVLIHGNRYVTRDGLLHVAHRSGQFDGIEIIGWDETPTHWRAVASVYRKDMSHPFTYQGRYPKRGKNSAYGPEMAIKCAEVMALRRAFNVAVPVLEEAWDTEADFEDSGGPASGPDEPNAPAPPETPPAHGEGEGLGEGSHSSPRPGVDPIVNSGDFKGRLFSELVNTHEGREWLRVVECESGPKLRRTAARQWLEWGEAE